MPEPSPSTPRRSFGAFGDAGMVVTASEPLFRRLRRLRKYGMEQEYVSLEEGYNSRLDEMQAALLNLGSPCSRSRWPRVVRSPSTTLTA